MQGVCVVDPSNLRLRALPLPALLVEVAALSNALTGLLPGPLASALLLLSTLSLPAIGKVLRFVQGGLELPLGLRWAIRTLSITAALATAVPGPVMFPEHLILGQRCQRTTGLINPNVRSTDHGHPRNLALL